MDSKKELKHLAAYLCVSCGQISIQKDTQVAFVCLSTLVAFGLGSLSVRCTTFPEETIFSIIAQNEVCWTVWLPHAKQDLMSADVHGYYFTVSPVGNNIVLELAIHTSWDPLPTHWSTNPHTACAASSWLA